MGNCLIAVLGRGESPVDGVEDYCKYLGKALGRRGIQLEAVRVRWDELGWIRALRKLRREATGWRGSWVVVQYTALAWSRRGFPFGVLLALTVLRRRGIRCAVVFHEPCRQGGDRWIDGLRGRCQDWVVRRLYARAARVIFLDPLEKIGWLSPNTPNGQKASFIPIGANLPDPSPEDSSTPDRNGDVKTVVVFCLSGPSNRQREIDDIAHAMKIVTQRGVRARVIFVGRGIPEAKNEIDHAFSSVSAEVVQIGLKDAAELRTMLSSADVMLCVRGRLYMRRGSAIAGIACGLPLVGYSGEAEGTPLEEAGIELVPYRDRDALGEALTTILSDPEKQKLLSSRSSQAQQKYFSWDQIADSYVRVFRDDKSKLKLLLYSHDWAPAIGGIPTYVMTLARTLAADPWYGVDVTVVTRTLPAQMDDRALPFRVVRRPGLLGLFRLVKTADVLHLAGAALLPLLFGLLLGRSIAVEHDGYQAICPNGLLIYGADRTVCPSHFMQKHYYQCIKCQSVDRGYLGSVRATALTFIRRWLTKRVNANLIPSHHVGMRISLPRSKLIYHGVATKVTPATPFSAINACISFAFAGRLVPEKGADVLLRAASQLRKSVSNFYVRIVGDGPERNRLERMSRELGLSDSVDFVGAVPADKVDSVLSTAQVVVIPSTWEDVAPLVVPEQMMQARLLIVSDIAGLGELVGEYGLKFPPGDAAALARCMQRVVEDPQAADELRRSAQQHAIEVHSESRMAEAHATLYHSLFAKRAGRISVRVQDAER